MSGVASRVQSRKARHERVRKRVVGNAERPRLTVFRSLKQIYAQIVDDEKGRTLAAASSLKLDAEAKRNGGNKTQVARLVGSEIARRGREAGVSRVVFDRGGYRYHGRVKSLAQAAREGGLEF